MGVRHVVVWPVGSQFVYINVTYVFVAVHCSALAFSQGRVLSWLSLAETSLYVVMRVINWYKVGALGGSANGFL